MYWTSQKEWIFPLNLYPKELRLNWKTFVNSLFSYSDCFRFEELFLFRKKNTIFLHFPLRSLLYLPLFFILSFHLLLFFFSFSFFSFSHLNSPFLPLSFLSDLFLSHLLFLYHFEKKESFSSNDRSAWWILLFLWSQEPVGKLN